VAGSGRTLSQVAGSGRRCVRLPAWGGAVRQWVWLRAAGVRREVFGCGRRGSGVRCVGLPGSAGGGVRREVHLAFDGEGQACSESGCRGQRAA
jgi:hypothetical protein